MKLEENLDLIYNAFFQKLNIDFQTGIVKDSNKRFATKIAIGENYVNCTKKLLFVSLDIGKDEYSVQNTFQNFKHRRESVCNKGELKDKNPHMAGVYGCALYFLKDNYKWEKEWQILANQNQFFKEALITNNEILPQDVLSNISLINFYNFVKIGRVRRTGDSDRIFIEEKTEIQLLIDIINTINPDKIIIQSKSLRNYFINYIKPNISEKIELFVGYHPSVFGRGIKYRKPIEYINNLMKGKL
jgi:hypothetical protein